MRIRYGIVGCGHYGAEAARLLHESEHAEVAAVYSATGAGARRVSGELGCETAASMDELAARADIDAVVVASPNYAHREAVLKAAKAGKHVFCEKPLALSSRDAADMVEACRASGKVLMISYMMRFYDGVRRMKELISQGRIGKPLVAHMERTAWYPPRTEEDAKPGWKYVQALSGGHLFHHIHELDLMYWLLGPIASVYCAGGNMAHHPERDGDQDDVLLTTLHFESGALGTVHCGSAFRIHKHAIQINGTEGSLELDFRQCVVTFEHRDGVERFPLFNDPEGQERMVALYRDGQPKHGKPTDRPPHYFKELFEKEIHLFQRKIAGLPVSEHDLDLFTGRAAQAGIEAAEAALESKRQGIPIQIK